MALALAVTSTGASIMLGTSSHRNKPLLSSLRVRSVPCCSSGNTALEQTNSQNTINISESVEDSCRPTDRPANGPVATPRNRMLMDAFIGIADSRKLGQACSGAWLNSAAT